MGRSLGAVALILLFLATLSSSAAVAANNMPQQSRDKLEDVFARVSDNLWLKSDEAFDEGRLDVSVGLCRFIVEIDPTFLEAYDVGAWLLDSDNRPAEAEALYTREAAANPKRYEPFFDMGMFYDSKKDYAKAEKCFQEATRRSAPTMVWRMLAHMREKLQNHQGALEVWETVKKMDPSDKYADSAILREKAAVEESKRK